MTKMMVKGQLSSNKEEAEDLWISSTARKQSLLPKGRNYIILNIFNLNMLLNTKKIMFPEFDDKDNKDNDRTEDEEDDDFV